MADKKKGHKGNMELEEVSEFPEKVSISEDIDTLESEEMLEDLPDAVFEEITDLEEKVTDNMEIADGYVEQSKGEGSIDILDLTSEIDQLSDVTEKRQNMETTNEAETQVRSEDKDDKSGTGQHTHGASSEGMYFDNDKNEFIIEDLPDEELDKSEYHDTQGSTGIDDTRKEKESIGEEADVLQQEDEDKLTIEIPEEFKKKMSENMDMENFGSIDLHEAEEIANEDILFLNEDDLVEELEDYELTPVDKENGAEKEDEKQEKKVKEEAEEVIAEQPEEEKVPLQEEYVKEEVSSGEQEVHPMEEEEPVKEVAVEEVPVDISPAEDSFRETRDEKGHEATREPGDEEKEDPSLQAPEEISKEREIIAEPEEDAVAGEQFSEETVYQVPTDQQQRETIPAELAMTERVTSNIQIVDDEMVDREYEEVSTVFEEDSLDRISSGIIEVVEGDAKILQEADLSRDEENIAHIMTGTLPTFEDLLIDFEEEFKFKDDDIIFIDNAFMADDYDKYLHEIDEYYEQKKKKGITPAVELLGLTRDEMSFFENSVFEKEFETVNISNQFGVDQLGMDQSGEDFDIVKNVNYIISDSDSLTEREKKSIEEDVESEGAVIFEENVDDIVNRIKKMDPDFTTEDEIIQPGRDEVKETTRAEEEAVDISDNVVIIDNKDDLNRFVDTMPSEKQENIKKLMAYLDDLFEKLPEDVIKNFANSEYFDLYVKVLNDLGI